MEFETETKLLSLVGAEYLKEVNQQINIICDIFNDHILRYIKISSSKSIVFVYDKIVIKVEKNTKKYNEIDIYNKFDLENAIVPLLFFIDFRIPSHLYISVYKKVNTIEIENIDENELKKMIIDTLINIQKLHEKNIKHGDVSIYNIGKDDNGNYLLYDFDDSIITEDTVSDITDFYDNLNAKFKNKFPDILQNFSDIIQANSEKETRIVKSLGKYKERILITKYYEQEIINKLSYIWN